MVEIITMSIVGGLLVVGAVMMGVESRHAARLAAAYLERFDHVAHGHYDGLAASRAKAALARWSISAQENGALQHEAGVTAACA